MGVLEGRRALVTGGASGIGLATVRRLLSEGAAAAIVDVSPAGAGVAGQVGATFVQADCSDATAVAEAFARAASDLGGVDIAYMNAGVTTQLPDRDPGDTFDITALTEDAYRRIMGINVDGVVYGVREAARAMSESGGSIVATASIAGLIAYQGDPIYALTKHAVVGLVRGLGASLLARGITINAICPGITDTPLVGDDAKRFLTDAGFPIIPPEQIADAVVTAITSGETGQCWVCQPGRDATRYEFRGVPGPRAPGAEGMAPPSILRA